MTTTEPTTFPPQSALSDDDQPLGYSKSPSLNAALFQRIVGWIFLIPVGLIIVFLMRHFRGYRVKDVEKIRAQYREIARDPRPLLICANHLTFIDSAILIWALARIRWYFFHFNYFSWNLPAGDFFRKTFIFRVVAYPTKCIFIHRDGTKRHRSAILDLCRDLIERGETVTIFPEGQRSRTGKFDTSKLAFGVGKIVTHIPNCRVMCAYIRSDKQVTFSNWPPKDSNFHIDLQVISPATTLKGREAYRDLTQQIVSTISKMEENYFSSQP